MLNGLDLFSGIGGLALALENMVTPVAYCEIDRYAQSVLLSRMASGQLPRAPIWDDIRTLHLGEFGRTIDIVYGGFPCQDRSLAGARKGLAGQRSSLFWEMVRIVDECRPTFVFVENPKGTKECRGDLPSAFEALGYQVREGTLSAAEIGADHLRERLFILAYAGSERLERLELHKWAWPAFARASSLSLPKLFKKADCPPL